jgi:hypothetical protein
MPKAATAEMVELAAHSPLTPLVQLPAHRHLSQLLRIADSGGTGG